MSRDLASTLLHEARVRLLRDYPAQIAKCLDALSDDELWWRPNGQANAVGNLLLHLAGSNRYHIEGAIGGLKGDRDRAAEFATHREYSRDELLSIWNDALARVQAVLDGLDPGRLMETTDRTGQPSTYAQILLHVTHHNAVHLGQIVWITKLLHPGQLDDIWMATRER